MTQWRQNACTVKHQTNYPPFFLKKFDHVRNTIYIYNSAPRMSRPVQRGNTNSTCARRPQTNKKRINFAQSQGVRHVLGSTSSNRAERATGFHVVTNSKRLGSNSTGGSIASARRGVLLLKTSTSTVLYSKTFQQGISPKALTRQPQNGPSRPQHQFSYFAHHGQYIPFCALDDTSR